MPSRAREKQLAKLAARRQAEAAARRRRRTMFIAIGGGLVIAVVVAVVMGIVLGNKPTAAAASVTPTPSASTAASPCGTPTPPKDSTKTKPTFDKPPPMTINPDATYTATFVTSCGTFEAQLLPKTDPQGVNSFVFLANKGFYDGLTFHRIVKDFIIQGGDPKGDGTGGPGYETPVTVTKGATFDAPGVLAFAHSPTGGNGSQFFVTLAPRPDLNPSATSKYTIFGNVTKGMAIVTKIGSVPTVKGPLCASSDGSCSPTEPIFILKVTISEKS